MVRALDRRTGGLESGWVGDVRVYTLDRRTGGLEIYRTG